MFVQCTREVLGWHEDEKQHFTIKADSWCADGNPHLQPVQPGWFPVPGE